MTRVNLASAAETACVVLAGLALGGLAVIGLGVVPWSAKHFPWVTTPQFLALLWAMLAITIPIQSRIARARQKRKQEKLRRIGPVLRLDA